MVKHQGCTSISLGAPVANYSKDAGIEIKGFYKARSDKLPLLDTSVRLSWNENSLFVLFTSNVKDMVGFPPATDIVVFYLRLNSFANGEYFKFVAKRDRFQEGFFRSPNSTLPVAINGYSVLHNDVSVNSKWEVLFTIPWCCVGGLPNTFFGVQMERLHLTTGEITSPSAIELYNKLDDDLFIEAILGGDEEIFYSSGGLTKLLSGKKKWQLPALLEYPSNTELREIWKLQGSLHEPTNIDNFEERIRLTQLWYDLLAFEGVSFLEQAGLWLQSEGQYSPWTARNLVNRCLRDSDYDNAYKILDLLLSQFDKVSRRWFVDGSPCNIRDDGWHTVDTLESLIVKEREVELLCSVSGKKISLFIAFPRIGGVRIWTEQQGRFSSKDCHNISLVDKGQSNYELQSDRYTVSIVSGKNWIMSFRAKDDKKEKIVLRNGSLSILFDDNKNIISVDFKYNMESDESIFGLGERYNAFNQRKKVITMHQLDAWEGINGGMSNQSYKIIPLWHSSKGYSLFWNTSWYIRIDIGVALENIFRATAHGSVFDLYIWLDTYTNNLKSYTDLTGKPLLPPKWVFEPWMGGGSQVWNKNPDIKPASAMIDAADKFKELDIPHSAIFAEGVGSNDPDLYPSMERHGLRVLAWGYQSIWALEKKVEGLKEVGLPIIRDENGKQYKFDGDLKVINGYIDFTHPFAELAMNLEWKTRLDMGLSGMMVDFGDLVPDGATFFDGVKGVERHNSYSYEYHKTMNKVFKNKLKNDFVLFGRAASPGTQSFVCHFAGDHLTNFTGMKAALIGALNLAVCGFPFWGSDIGGYSGMPDEEVYIRWLQFGAFSPLMRIHGTYPREPWNYSETTVAIYRKYAWLRENMLDYLYACAEHSHRTGDPMMKPLLFAFPHSHYLDGCDDEYLLGDDLLVAPLCSQAKERLVLFPPGVWIHLWSGKQFTGEKAIMVEAPLDQIPLFLRAGCRMPIQVNRDLKLGESMRNGSIKAFLTACSDNLSSPIQIQKASE